MNTNNMIFVKPTKGDLVCIYSNSTTGTTLIVSHDGKYLK